jgi:hypothetical protein
LKSGIPGYSTSRDLDGTRRFFKEIDIYNILLSFKEKAVPGISRYLENV